MKYVDAFEIALQDREMRGEAYKAGVIRAAALAAAERKTIKGAVAAMERTFHAFRRSLNPAWDGSIA